MCKVIIFIRKIAGNNNNNIGSMERTEKKVKQDTVSRSLLERNVGSITEGSFGDGVGHT